MYRTHKYIYFKKPEGTIIPKEELPSFDLRCRYMMWTPTQLLVDAITCRYGKPIIDKRSDRKKNHYVCWEIAKKHVSLSTCNEGSDNRQISFQFCNGKDLHKLCFSEELREIYFEDVLQAFLDKAKC